MRIVIADDDSVSRLLTRNTLQRAGYDVIAVENGGLALDHLLRLGGPRLALLDWIMPVLDGPSVCRAIRARTDQPYSYIILLTSRESKADLVAGLEAGADDYLTKPYYGDELKARLRTGQRIVELQDRLFYAARHDPLTLLPNRAYFLDRITQCVGRSKEDADYRFAVLFIDLDGFKEVNDSFGHLAGDALLALVAKRLSNSIRRDDPVSQASSIKAFVRAPREDLLARIGGDEFTVLLDDIRDHVDATNVAKRIQSELIPAFLVGGRQIHVTASIGVTVSTDGYSDAEEMLRYADAAMYRSKATGCVVVSEEGVLRKKKGATRGGMFSDSALVQ